MMHCVSVQKPGEGLSEDIERKFGSFRGSSMIPMAVTRIRNLSFISLDSEYDRSSADSVSLECRDQQVLGSAKHPDRSRRYHY